MQPSLSLPRLRRPRPPRRGARALAFVTLTLAAACRGGSTPAPDATPVPEVPEVSISARCSGAATIDPATGAGSADWAPVTPSETVACFDLTATAADATGVAADTGFVLASAEAIDAEAVKALLRVWPPVSFDVTEAQAAAPAGGPRRAYAAEDPVARFRVVPNIPLAEGAVYRFEMHDRSTGGRAVQSWAFQTRRPLRVVQTLPADRSTEVPLTTGIELVFSHAGMTGVAERLSIDPPVEGRVEVRKRTAVFVPASLAPATLYTVRLDAGVGLAGADDTLAEPYQFQFKTAAASDVTPSETPPQFFRPLWEAPTGAAPALSVFSYAGEATSPYAGRPLAVTVYRYPDLPTFVAALDTLKAVPAWARDSRTGIAVDPARPALTEAVRFEATLEPIGTVGELLVRFPEPLPAGRYLVDGRLGDLPLQAWLQVTDLAPYVAVSAAKTLVWANDASTGQPVAGAQIRVAGADAAAGTTGDDGVAFIDTPPGLVGEVPAGWPPGATMPAATGTLVVAAGGAEVVVPLGDAFQNAQHTAGMQEFAERGDATRYWRYVYSDRWMYRPTDTVHFWGVVRHRDEPPAARTLAVDIVAGDAVAMSGIDYGPAVAARTTVEAGPSGTFIGALPIAGVAPGSYQLRVMVGDLVVLSQWFEVQDFVKPAYKIDVAPSRQAILAGESVDFDISAAFFEGSPVPGVGLRYNGDVEGELTTDTAGRATLTYTSTVGSAESPIFGDVRWASVMLAPVLAEEGDIGGNATVRVFNAAVSLEAQARVEGATGTVTGTLRAVDLARINDGTAKHLDDYRADPIAGGAVSARVEEVAWERRETGETYDPITKQVVKQYEYVENRTPIGTFDTTTDAAGAFALDFPVQAGRSYEVVASTRDADGRATAQLLYVDGGGTRVPGGLTELAELTRGPYAIGDTVTAEMRRDGATLDDGDGARFLFVQARNDIRDYTVQSGPRFSFAFADAHVPNVNLAAVQFADGTYREVRYPLVARLDHATRGLTVNVSSDQPSYAPGETATVNVVVTDAAGEPVQAEVLLSAVDDAIFRMQGQGALDSLGLLDALYRSVGSGILSSYASHQAPKGAMGAEGGGGGGMRDTFKDTALFERVTTGADGRASVTMDLPDNLTSWRVAGLALTDDLWAGAGTGLVAVTLPLFADATLNQTYLAADRPALRLRAFGAALAAGDAVRFEVAAPTLTGETLAAEGSAFEAVDIPLPALVPGRHALAITVTAGDRSDSVERVVDVVPSRLARATTTYAEVDAGGAFTPPAVDDGQAVVVTLTDLNRGRYYGAVRALATGWSDRLDAAVARHAARAMAAAYFDDEIGGPALHAGAYRTTDGGLALLPYGGTDLDASVRAAAVAPDAVGREALASYLFKQVDAPDTDRARAAAALFGLAALGQPVLPEVASLAAQADLTPIEKLYAGLAAAELGDEATARRLYGGLIAEQAQGRGAAARLNVGDDQADVLAATALAAVLGAMLGDDLAPALFQYTLDNASPDTLHVLEQAAFLAEALPRLASTPAGYRYTEAGASRSATLADAGAVTLRLTAAQLAELGLAVTDGKLGVAVTALAPFDPAALASDPEVTVSRSFLAGATADVVAAPVEAAPGGAGAEGGVVEVAPGDLVRVTLGFALGPKAVDGCYQVTDLLPSGLVPVTQPYQRGITFVEEGTEPDYPYSVDGQRVSFCVDRGREGKPLKYYARVMGKGVFAAEPALIQAQRAPESANVSGAATVEVK